MSRAFDRQTARDVLNELQQDIASFKNDDLNTSLAREIAEKSWHLCDWIFHESGPKLGFDRLRDLQDFAKQQCPELAYMQDICNESKHAKITRYSPVVEEAYDATVFEAGVFEEGVFSRGLMIDIVGGGSILFSDTLDNIFEYWRSHFNI